MPLINFECTKCGGCKNKFVKVKDIQNTDICGCGGEMKRMLKAPSQMSVMTVDNGVQDRAVVVSQTVVDKEREKVEKGYDIDEERKGY